MYTIRVKQLMLYKHFKKAKNKKIIYYIVNNFTKNKNFNRDRKSFKVENT